MDGVDIDPVTMALGDEFFAATGAPGRSFAIDGRVFVNLATDAAWDVIHVDAYANQIYVPAHLASREFFEQVHARLAPGGVIALQRRRPAFGRSRAALGRDDGSPPSSATLALCACPRVATSSWSRAAIGRGTCRP